jgi:hypothetical protein
LYCDVEDEDDETFVREVEETEEETREDEDKLATMEDEDEIAMEVEDDVDTPKVDDDADEVEVEVGEVELAVDEIRLEVDEATEEEATEDREEVEDDNGIEDELRGAGRHVPSPAGSPDSHLQLEEQPSPLTVFPSSHSSPKVGFHTPSPHPDGVAPRVMMYGNPTDPSANVLDPGPTAFRAIARAWKALEPVDGYEEKAS